MYRNGLILARIDNTASNPAARPLLEITDQSPAVYWVAAKGLKSATLFHSKPFVHNDPLLAEEGLAFTHYLNRGDEASDAVRRLLIGRVEFNQSDSPADLF